MKMKIVIFNILITGDIVLKFALAIFHQIVKTTSTVVS